MKTTIQPKNRKELVKIIEDTVKKKGYNCNLKFIDTSSIGEVLNADINGALNILRKYLIKNAINEFPVIQEIIDRGLFFRPSRITIY